MAARDEEGTRAPMKVAGYDIPVGVDLMPCVYLAHQRAQAWERPRRFWPERFIGAKVDPYTWFPFGGGVRRTITMAPSGGTRWPCGPPPTLGMSSAPMSAPTRDLRGVVRADHGALFIGLVGDASAEACGRHGLSIACPAR